MSLYIFISHTKSLRNVLMFFHFQLSNDFVIRSVYNSDNSWDHKPSRYTAPVYISEICTHKNSPCLPNMVCTNFVFNDTFVYSFNNFFSFIHSSIHSFCHYFFHSFFIYLFLLFITFIYYFY
jgi:hypothetical protein